MNDFVTLRSAQTADIPILLEFEQGVVEAERPFDITLKRTDTRYYDIEEMISAPHIQLLVAEIDGKLAGCGYARLEDSKMYLQHRRHAYLGFMYVKPEHRGKGINKIILEGLRDWSVKQGVPELRLEVYVDNVSAVKAYEKIGFSKHMFEMRLKAE